MADIDMVEELRALVAEDPEEAAVFSQSEPGPRLRALRQRCGASQRGLARMIGVSPTTLRRYEAGKATPGKEQLVLLAELLNTSVLFLVRGENPPSFLDLAVARLAWTRLRVTPRQASMVLLLIEGILSQLPKADDVVN
jgi:transcriptional regulator with XRE-family HTH domain